jgi:hypothetical protein
VGSKLNHFTVLRPERFKLRFHNYRSQNWYVDQFDWDVLSGASRRKRTDGKMRRAERRVEKGLLRLSVGKASFHKSDIQPRDNTDGGIGERCEYIHQPTIVEVSWERYKAGVAGGGRRESGRSSVLFQVDFAFCWEWGGRFLAGYLGPSTGGSHG